MVGFTPVEEVEKTLVVPRDLAEKEVRDFFREEGVEELRILMLTEDLVVVEVLMEVYKVLAAVEGTLVEAVEIMHMTPVGEGEDLTTSAQIKKMSAVLTQLVMVM